MHSWCLVRANMLPPSYRERSLRGSAKIGWVGSSPGSSRPGSFARRNLRLLCPCRYSGSRIGEFGGSAASGEAKSQAGLRTMLYLYIMIVAVVRFLSI
jgi:hypothetical protein